MARRGVILPVVLFVLLLVGLLGGMFAFRVHADRAALEAVTNRSQVRLAAEAGVDYVKLMLRAARFDMTRWYHNPEELHRVIVWAYDTDPAIWGTTDELGPRDMVYRFSIVADDTTDDEDYIRFGLTDESSKLNLNLATAAELLTLVTEAVGDDQSVFPQDIVDAIIDWRDPDGAPVGEATDTEGDYYRDLDRPYRVKNADFDSVEELLLVKGITGTLLYGEDFDRNGLITPNEDDGDRTFPLDNQDGVLNRGLYPYLTVHSFESNVANDNRRRIFLMNEAEAVKTQLTELFPDEPNVVEFIVNATHAPPPAPGGNGGVGGGKGGGAPGGQGGQGGQVGGQAPPTPNGVDGTPDTGAPPPAPQRPGRRPRPRRGDPVPQNPPPVDGTEGDRGTPNGKIGLLQQRRDPEAPPTDDNAENDGADGMAPPVDETTPPDDADPGDDNTAPDEEGDDAGADEDEDSGDEEGDDKGETGDGGGTPKTMRTPVSLMRDQTIGGNPVPSPLTFAHLSVLLDRTTMVREQEIRGLININTAPAAVLRLLELSDEQVRTIVEMRTSIVEEDKATTAWLLAQEVLDLDTYERIAPRITARGQQFTIEALGYADHIGMVARLQVIVNMVGPIAQTIYYRDLTQLGGHYPIREEDADRIRAR